MSIFLSIARQPLLHFLVLGGLVFAAYYYIDGTEPAPPMNDITIDRATAERLSAGFAKTWRRKPTQQELTALIDDFIREEVLVREAKAFALDQNDAVIRRRLRQKMEFLTESVSAARTPEQQELEAFFEANSGRFATDARLAMEQVYLGEEADKNSIDALLVSLEAGEDFTTLGQRSLLPPDVSLSPQTAIDGMFGAGFSATLLDLEPGKWLGPVRSGYGNHLVRVTAREDAAVPPLASIRDRVLREWHREKADELSDQEYTRMLDRYTVNRPGQAETADLVQ